MVLKLDQDRHLMECIFQIIATTSHPYCAAIKASLSIGETADHQEYNYEK